MSEKLNSLKEEFAPLYDCISFGFDCGDGWYDILHDLSVKITAACKENNIEIDPKKEFGFGVIQVKEKYGTLRVYTSFSFDVIDVLIEEAQEKTHKTCEECGNAGVVRKDLWLFCRCDECWNKEK